MDQMVNRLVNDYNKNFSSNNFRVEPEKMDWISETQIKHDLCTALWSASVIFRFIYDVLLLAENNSAFFLATKVSHFLFGSNSFKDPTVLLGMTQEIENEDVLKWKKCLYRQKNANDLISTPHRAKIFQKKDLNRKMMLKKN
jgi:hypothetical protein